LADPFTLFFAPVSLLCTNEEDLVIRWKLEGVFAFLQLHEFPGKGKGFGE